MAFPTNPTNGQTANVNGVSYTYSNTIPAWTVTTYQTGNIGGNNVTAASTVSGAILSSTGIISAVGNITGSYLFGNGSQLTGIVTSSGNISNGTSSISIPVGSGNANITIGGVSNVAVFTTAGITATGTVVTGNITGNNATISTSLAVGNTTPTGTVGQIVATNSITAFYSDRRLKQNIVPISNALDKVDQLTGVTYTQNKLAEDFGYNDYSQQVGVIAQEVQQVLPEVVKLAPFDMGPDGTSRTGEHYLTVQYEKIIPLLVEAIKELKKEIATLKGEK
jgi:hypothetical protein